MFSFKKSEVVTDPARIDAFLNRGVENVFPNKDFLRAKMIRGEQQTIYLGVDPTGPTLHMGHAIVLRKLGEFQKLGHKVILLIGDFTATIGDPTDKTATRKTLTPKEVLDNARLYKDQASHYISFTGTNRAELKYNSQWLSKMNFADVLNLASHMTVDQMLKRDMFAKRIEESKPIYIHEFMYPLMQGYDSVAMNVDGEIGGNDQTFNMLAGRDLMKSLKNKEKFVIAVKLLTDPTGKKMGKTENNAVALNQTAEDMFGKVMSWTDGLIIPAFEICTDVPMVEVKKLQDAIASGANPKDAKVRLAKEIITMIHGSSASDRAEKAFESTFKKGEIPEDAVLISVVKGAKLADTLVTAQVITSKSEFRRLVEGGGVSEVGKDTIQDCEYTIDRNIDLRIGKKRFVRIRIK